MSRDSLDHGLAREAVPRSHVEDACLVNGQIAHQCKSVDSAVAVNRHCVDKGGEAEPIPQGEGNNACAGQQSLSCHIDNGHLQHGNMSEGRTNVPTPVTSCSQGLIYGIQHMQVVQHSDMDNAQQRQQQTAGCVIEQQVDEETRSSQAALGTHLRELPELVDWFVVQAKAGLHAIRIVRGFHAFDLWALLVAEAVAMQVVDVRHVNGILKHTPVIAVKLYLTCRKHSAF